MSVKPLLDAFRDYLSLREEEEVREWLGRFGWKLNQRNLTATPLGPERHLAALDGLVGRGEQRLVQVFTELAPRLHWMRSYGPEDFGQHFFDHYAHVELIGQRGHFACDTLAAGLVMYGPGIDYPNHWHVAEEIYIPLTSGALWSSDNEPFVERAGGEYVFHTSNMPHAIKTNTDPLLALWVWRGGDLTQKGNY